MKRNYTIAIACIVFIIAACNNENKTKPQSLSELEKIAADTANFTQIQWIDSAKDFGTIKEGEVIEMKFKFKNIGTKPLFVLNVKAGCGCTSPDYTKEAIAPQQEGWVKGIFNSMNQKGMVNKNIQVTTNTSNKTISTLLFSGSVE